MIIVFVILDDYLEVVERNKELRIAVFVAGRGEKVFPGGPSGRHHGQHDEEEDEEEDGHERDGADKQDNEYDARLRMKMQTEAYFIFVIFLHRQDFWVNFCSLRIFKKFTWSRNGHVEQ